MLFGCEKAAQRARLAVRQEKIAFSRNRRKIGDIARQPFILSGANVVKFLRLQIGDKPLAAFAGYAEPVPKRVFVAGEDDDRCILRPRNDGDLPGNVTAKSERRREVFNWLRRGCGLSRRI